MTRTRWQVRATLALTLMALMGGSMAMANEDAEKKAVAAAETWLALIDNGEIDKSWETAAALFRGAVTKEQWIKTVPAARGPFGKLISREVDSTKFTTTLPGAPDGEYVVIQFNAKYENKAEAVETVTPMKDPDGEWRVSGYFIR